MTGSAVAFRKSDGRQGVIREVVGAYTSLAAEGGAILTALQEVSEEEDLTILTDSANMMFILQDCSQRDWWKDFSRHRDRALLEDIARAVASRTARTTFVKVKSH